MVKNKSTVEPFEPVKKTKEPNSQLVKDIPEIVPELKTEDKKQGIDFMELLNNPMAQSMISGCKDLFKKEKPEQEPTDHLEVFVKGPSDAVLKFFNRE